MKAVTKKVIKLRKASRTVGMLAKKVNLINDLIKTLVVIIMAKKRPLPF